MSDRKQIPCFPGYYASDDGRIWSDRKRQNVAIDSLHEIAGGIDGNGYRIATLSVGSRQFTRTFHSLILLTFVGPPPFSRAHSRHRNSDQRDNRLENLCYGTAAENASDRLERGPYSRRRKMLSAAEITEIRAARRAETVAALALRFGVCLNTIYRVTKAGDARHEVRKPK